MESELIMSWPMWAAAGIIILVAGLTQGALGFGFPTVSTPILALLIDVKTAIIINLLPNLTVNLISIVRGGNWSVSLGKYWPVAAYVLIGSFLGAKFLAAAPQEPLRLVLALIIIVYLYQRQLAKLDWSWLARRPRWSALTFGLTGGFFSGAVNQSLPPLLIYFTLLGLEITAMTQILNLCFLGGKVVQAATLAVSGDIKIHAALANIPLTLVGLTGMYIGTRLQRRFSAETYSRLLRNILFFIAIVLIWQGSRHYFLAP